MRDRCVRSLSIVATALSGSLLLTALLAADRGAAPQSGAATPRQPLVVDDAALGNETKRRQLARLRAHVQRAALQPADTD
jgi:hypothetical protein